MAWITPKTNWSGSRDADGVYTGDYFQAADWNRILGNATVLNDYLDSQQRGVRIETVAMSVGTYLNQAMIDQFCLELSLIWYGILGEDTPSDADINTTFFNYQTLNLIETTMAEAYEVIQP